jgi:hypothetical protein
MSLEHAPQRDDGKPLQAPLADDLLIGAAAIAQELGRNKAAVYHLHRTRRLPIGKLGKNLIASRSKLRRAALALAG